VSGGRRVDCAANIGRVPADVFEYVTTPGHWPLWHPSSIRVTGTTDHSLLTGEECTEEYLVAGRRGVCVWKVLERDAPRKWTIAASPAEGGSATITYTLSAAGDGTRFLRSMTYAMPNWFFGLLDSLFLQKRIRAESEEAVARLKATLENLSVFAGRPR
jgi:uncharacterized protein YndB with AHSA1/START domain